ncbi:hypothetical protein PoB_002420600 [Plakobranchus ocellatus]|uniref:Uncharacterized protein n=1 Tax=Plakobranchus ocellatus TaxID=259542 RepID=A0AAV3ZEP0_9GAST|nr:hypothetical protein PoB_002420600 [Plakobranchus ocellatus]
MATMTIYAHGNDDNDDYDLQWRRMRHNTPQAQRTSSVTVVEDSTGCQKYGLPVVPKLHTLCLPYNRRPFTARDEGTSGSPQPLTLKLLSGFPQQRTLRQRPKYRALTRHCRPDNHPGSTLPALDPGHSKYCLPDSGRILLPHRSL